MINLGLATDSVSYVSPRRASAFIRTFDTSTSAAEIEAGNREAITERANRTRLKLYSPD